MKTEDSFKRIKDSRIRLIVIYGLFSCLFCPTAVSGKTKVMQNSTHSGTILPQRKQTSTLWARTIFDSSYKDNNSVIPLNKIFTKTGSPKCLNISFAFSSYFFHNSNKQAVNQKNMQNYINIYQIYLLSFKFSFQNPHHSTPYDSK